MQNWNKDTLTSAVSAVVDIDIDPERKNSAFTRNLKRAGLVAGVAVASVGLALVIRPVAQKLSDTFDK